MRLIKVILEKSAAVDSRFHAVQAIPVDFCIAYPVPVRHPRAAAFSTYTMRVGSVEEFASGPPRVWVVTPTVLPALQRLARLRHELTLILDSAEDRTKTSSFMTDVIANHRAELTVAREVVAIGGGLILNVAAYVAETCELDLRLAPSTALAMADGAGGKVRMNAVHAGRYYKHFYKSFWEPSEILIDPTFLQSLPVVQKRIGLVEIIKHGVQQSPALFEFLERTGEALLTDNDALLKAICWAADLKRVCLQVDSEENDNGSRSILRAGHDISDRLEEELSFEIPHGYAVAVGLIDMFAMHGDDYKRRRTVALLDRLGIPYSVSAWQRSLKGLELSRSHV